MLTQLFNLFFREYNWNDYDMYTEEEINKLKVIVEDLINNKARPFLEWLIKNWYIEKIPSEKKSWPDLNDYIKYIAETEDPIKTLSDMIKTPEK